LYFVVRVRCRRKESLRSLSQFLMSFLFLSWYSIIMADIISYSNIAIIVFILLLGIISPLFLA